MESPKHVTPLFKVPPPPSSVLTSAIKSPSIPPANQQTADDTITVIETSDVDLFGDLGASHTGTTVSEEKTDC